MSDDLELKEVQAQRDAPLDRDASLDRDAPLDHDAPLDGVAIVGMSGRFPGASSVAEFWKNQLAGLEGISHFSVDELESVGSRAAAQQPNYVRARAILKDIDQFDPEFFSILPKEAALMDPQHRLFLECCWEALEDAGHDPYAYSGSIGVIAGSSYGSYFLSRLSGQAGFVQDFLDNYQIGNYPAMMGNQPEFLPTRVSYKFDLRGPGFAIQSACSTSLVAVCNACQSLLTYQSDMMLAGGVSITLPQQRGYHYQEGGMGSADGHCRPFDQDAHGTVFGSGVGVVLLKRVEDAIADGDQIYAVIRGFATNNDGAGKIGYTAPSVEGQANVIAMAQQAAGVDAETIGYVEAHGTATPLGDPIELAALTKAFRGSTDATQFCTIGTAKANVGHLDIAAGVTGLIHAAHVVRHGKLPGTLNFKKPTDKFEWSDSPFKVSATTSDWKTDGSPRRAGVSAFGVGGTNAHLILEESPQLHSDTASRAAQLLVLSARSPEALDAATKHLAAHIEAHPDVPLADTAFTLQTGRKGFDCRRSVVAETNATAVAALLASVGKGAAKSAKRTSTVPSSVCFMFPGQGTQYESMGRELYRSEAVFREAVDACAVILLDVMGLDLRDVFFRGDATRDLSLDGTQTYLAQPAIFTIEYALAKLWMDVGVKPGCMIGHSIGEFVAACLSGVLSLADALRLVATRGRLMQDLPKGEMLSVRMSEAELAPLLEGRLDLAAVNAPLLCVVSGETAAIAALEETLTARGAVHRRLKTSHAFHSRMMDPILATFGEEVRKARLSAPTIPYVSCVTGAWITAEEATSAEYWTRHLRESVRFSHGISTVLQQDDLMLLEVGPGSVLKTLAQQHSSTFGPRKVLTSLADRDSDQSESLVLLQTLGELWSGGVKPAWDRLHGRERRLRVSLPTYPFERRRFWFGDDLHSTTMAAIETTVSAAPQNEAIGCAPEYVATALKESLSMSTSMTSSGSASSTPMVIENQVSGAAQSRVDHLQSMVAAIFEDLSGLGFTGDDVSTSFLELGLDSLFLTQISQALQNKFGVKITFRQLMGDESTLDALASYLDRQLAPGKFEPAAPAVAGVVPTAASQTSFAVHPVPQTAAMFQPGSVSANPVEQLMRDQLQAMNQLFAQQLSMLQGGAAVPAASAVANAPAGATQEKPTARVVAPVQTKDSAGEQLKGYTPFKPLQKNVSGELTPRQIEHIHALTALYTSRTASSKRHTQESRQYLADPRVVAGFRAQWKEMVYPIITKASKGSRLWDLDGNEYIDILNGFGPIMLGHRPSYVEEAIDKQLHEGFEIGPQTILAGEVAKALCEMTGNERATFCNTGSEAVIAAMRLARTISGKSRVVFFAGDYHGMFDEVLVKGFKSGGVPKSAPLAPGIPRESVSNMTVLEYGSAESLEWIRTHLDEIAAVLVEPVQSRHPNLQPIEFLKELRTMTEEADVCLIFDEVVTGFRSHPGGCQALFGIRADLATYGKVIAGGMPMGILAGKARYMDALDGGMWQYGDESFPEVGVTFFAGTFVRHPLAMAACAAVLKHLKAEGPALQQRLTERTAGVIARLNALLEENEVPTRIETFASFFYFAFPSDFRFSSLFYYHLRSKGIHLLEGFPCFLTTEHTDADLDRIVQAFRETITEMQAGEVLPFPSKTIVGSVADVGVPALSAPITESQMEILLSADLSPEANCSFNESFTLYLNGKLDERALTESLTDLFRRHEALRATFDLATRTQFFAPAGDVDLQSVDLTSLDLAAQQIKFHELIRKDAAEPFDLKSGPLARMQLVRFASDRHALVFTAHHAVCDGWSINVLLGEMSALYSAKVSGTTATLEPLMPFGEYARSQELHFASKEGSTTEAYWMRQFNALPPLLDLPIDHARPAMKSFHGATYRKKIDAALLKQIKLAGARQKCTLFATLLGGFAALTARLSGQEDIVVGVPAAGQSLIEDRTLVGHCVNFVPMRVQPDAEASTAQLLDQVRKTVFDAYDHQNYTFGRLVRKLAIPRIASRLPLLEIQFNLEKVGGSLAFAGLQAEVDPNPKSFVNFDVFLNAVEGTDGLTLHVDYNTTLIDETTIARWMESYVELLTGLSTDVSQPLCQLPIVTASERELVVQSFNRTDADFPRNTCVHQLFEQQVAQTPHSVALQFEEQILSYTQLNERVNQLARYLTNQDVKAGDLVGVYMERSIELVVALLAVWKAGATYVPLDPTFPLERLTMVFEDLANPIVLTQTKIAGDLPSEGARVLRVDELWPVIELLDASNPNFPSDSSRVAYVIYTSGSTGRPKGVEVPQSNVVNLLASMAKTPGLGSTDVLVAVTTISFDISALEVYLPLVRGAKLVLASRAVASDGSQLLKLLRHTKATILQATPVTFRLLLAAGWKGQPAITAWCGGEALPRELANQIVELGVPLWNMYGPTETTIWSAVNRVSKSDGPVLVGGPIDNTTFYVLDAHRQLVPLGVAGELYIGGDGVARGYFKRPDLTSARFIPDPFSGRPSARFYRTGDLVRRLAHGEFEFLGRADGQIKLRGFRIELGEIETALAGYGGVDQAVVMLREDIPGDKRLVAYLVPTGGSTLVSNDLRNYLLGKLPDYMVPSAFIDLVEYPLTANGKIDRHALPAPDWAPAARGANYVAPRNEEEETFAKIWAEVLHLQQVGIEDSIFELGADSLHVFQIAARANQAGIEVRPRQILQYRTITAVMADLLVSAPASKTARLTPVSRAKYRVSQASIANHAEPADAGGPGVR